jgi:hypothetical protein
MKAGLGTFLATALLLASVTPVIAHHGNAAYDETKEVTLKGTVTEFEWANPHAQIYFDVKDAKGNVVHWGCETLSPGKLVRAGWTKDAVKPGDHITITLVAAKNGAPVGFLHKVMFDDSGKQLGITEVQQ